jgi:uncharacterized RDD family membrane protein YckC
VSDHSNPYAPPRASLEPEVDVRARASSGDVPVGTRFIHLIVDNIVRYLIATLVGFFFESAENPALGPILALLTYPAYYVFFEGVFGSTPAKLMTGSRVVAVGGGRPTFGQILGRTFARVVPFEPFSFLGDTPTGWHDRWSGTRVVRL